MICQDGKIKIGMKALVRQMDKPILFADLDNSTYPLIEEVTKRYNSAYNDNLQFKEITDYNYYQFIKPECKSPFKEFCTPDLFYSLKPYDGAVECLSILNEKYQLYFLTSGHPNTVEHRDNILGKHFKFYTSRQLIMCRNKQLLQGDVLIDDCLENLFGGTYKGIIYNMPWNKQVDENQIQTNRVFGWNQETLDIIDEVMRKRKEHTKRDCN